MNEWTTILTSAAVGAVVSQIITIIERIIDQRAMARQLAFSKAFEMAIRRTEIAMKCAEKSGRTATLYDEVFIANKYYEPLLYMFNKGKLPESTLRKAEESIIKHLLNKSGEDIKESLGYHND